MTENIAKSFSHRKRPIEGVNIGAFSFGEEISNFTRVSKPKSKDANADYESGMEFLTKDVDRDNQMLPEPDPYESFPMSYSLPEMPRMGNMTYNLNDMRFSFSGEGNFPYEGSSKNFESRTLCGQSTNLEQDDDVDNKEQVTFKKSCKLCTERRVRCSGPPGPCKTCLRRGLDRDLCVFLPRRKPGPKKREFDLLMNLSASLAMNDEKFVSESVPVVFNEFSMSLQVSAIMNQLKSVGFLNGLELECPGLYLQNYARKHILKAVRLWITLCGEHRLLMPISEFLACMKSYQQHSGENYDLDDVDLQKLFWLVEAGSDGNEKNEPCIQLTQFALLFVWIGSSQLQNVFDTKTVINLLYDWIHEDPIRIGNYYGFCSKKMVEEILEQNPGYPMYIPVYYLHEGYLGSMQYIQNDNIYHSIKYIIRNAASACLVDPVSGSGDYVVRHRLLLRHDMCGNAEIDPSANFESAGIDSVDTLLS